MFNEKTSYFNEKKEENSFILIRKRKYESMHLNHIERCHHTQTESFLEKY